MAASVVLGEFNPTTQHMIVPPISHPEGRVTRVHELLHAAFPEMDHVAVTALGRLSKGNVQFVLSRLSATDKLIFERYLRKARQLVPFFL